MKLFTNRYQEFKSSQGTPVRSTFGRPKFRLPYPLNYRARLITPGGWFMSGTDEEFTARYRQMLDDNGVEAIRNEFESIVRASHCDSLVLLCFDDVNRGLCHRTLFAEWWQEQTGEVVEELQRNAGQRQPVLF